MLMWERQAAFTGRGFDMKIVVFEDDPIDRKKLLQMINSWLIDKCHPDTVIQEFDSIRKLSFSLPALSQTDVFFLDIMTPESHDAGYRLAEEIRSTNIHAAIIFTTNSMEYITDAFEIFTYRYLTKPILPKKVYDALDHISLSRSYTGRYATEFHGIDDELLIENDQIIYIESNARSHQATVYQANGTTEIIRLSGTFSQLTDSSLPKEFIQCHRGYIINLNHVKRYDKAHVWLDNRIGESEIPIGHVYRESFINRLIDYHRGIEL